MSEVRFRLGDEDGPEFEKFLQHELTSDQTTPQGLTVTFQPSKSPTGGFGFPIPPEVIVFIQQHIHGVTQAGVAAVGTGVATGFGKEAGSWLWSKLRQFYTRQKAPSEIEVEVDGERKDIALKNSTEEPPKILTRINTAP